MNRKKKLILRRRRKCHQLRAEGKPIHGKERDTIRDKEGRKLEDKDISKPNRGDIVPNYQIEAKDDMF